MIELNEQEILRRNALTELRPLGIEPYPAELFEINATAAEIKENFEKDNSLYQDISIAGRIIKINRGPSTKVVVMRLLVLVHAIRYMKTE